MLQMTALDNSAELALTSWQWQHIEIKKILVYDVLIAQFEARSRKLTLGPSVKRTLRFAQLIICIPIHNSTGTDRRGASRASRAHGCKNE